MINCLYNIYPLFQKKKQIDLLDFIWHETKVVVGDPSRVPIYCPLVQRLINAKMPAAIVQQFPDVTPVIVAIPLAASDAPVWLPLGVNPADLDDDNALYDDVRERVLKKQNVIVKALKKMNCFFVEKRKS